MPFASTRELKEDALFRASEPLTGASGWETKVLDYLNKSYRELATGASPFLPEYVDDWWWMRAESYFILEPVYIAGYVSTTAGSTVVTFSVPPPFDPADWLLRVLDNDTPEVFQIQQGAGPLQPNQVLDAPYVGRTGTGLRYQLMRVNYYPVSGVKPQVIIGPMRSFRSPEQIYGVSPERMDELWPLSRLAPGPPQAFTILQELNEYANPGEKFEIRFSHGGQANGQQMRVDYWYRPVLDDLTDSTSSIPRVPLQWRHVLSDMALTQILLDKNDDRANAAALGARTTLAAMLKENRRRNVKVDFNVGHIYPRQQGLGRNRVRGPLRTDSGLIIG